MKILNNNMNKNILFLLVFAVSILTMGAGCAPDTTADIIIPDSSSTLPVNLPVVCTDQSEGTPVITSLSRYSGPVGTTLEIKGCNFSGFEGDKNIWIKNNQDVVGIIYGGTESTNNLLKITLSSPLCQNDNSYSGLPCDTLLDLTPGTYKIYTTPWGRKSNEVTFNITELITAQPSATTTDVTYYLLDKPASSLKFCNGANMSSAGYKTALTQKKIQNVMGDLAIEEKIQVTLRLAAEAGGFNTVYTRTASTTFADGIVTMHSANGWAGSSIFYCAWKPFVEKNLSQFPEVRKIKWETYN